MKFIVAVLAAFSLGAWLSDIYRLRDERSRAGNTRSVKGARLTAEDRVSLDEWLSKAWTTSRSADDWWRGGPAWRAPSSNGRH
jgi:hypothetical protein